MKAPLWSLPLSWSKESGCCSLCRYGATVLLFFWLFLWKARGSKLVTVSFRLQSQTFSSCLGGWGSGVGPCCGKEESPPPSTSLKLSSWQFTDSRATRRLAEVVIFHTSFPLRELSVDPHTSPLPLLLGSISNVSHLFLQVAHGMGPLKSKNPTEVENNWLHRVKSFFTLTESFVHFSFTMSWKKP